MEQFDESQSWLNPENEVGLILKVKFRLNSENQVLIEIRRSSLG